MEPVDSDRERNALEVEVESAVGYVTDKMRRLEEAFPGKPIVIGEVGWPSDGRTREPAGARGRRDAGWHGRRHAGAAVDEA